MRLSRIVPCRFVVRFMRVLQLEYTKCILAVHVACGNAGRRVRLLALLLEMNRYLDLGRTDVDLGFAERVEVVTLGDVGER